MADGVIRWRCHEARDRTEPTSKGVGESRGRAPRGERVRQKRRAPRVRKYRRSACARSRYLSTRLSALRLSDCEATVRENRRQSSGREQKAQRENDGGYRRGGPCGRPIWPLWLRYAGRAQGPPLRMGEEARASQRICASAAPGCGSPASRERSRFDCLMVSSGVGVIRPFRAFSMRRMKINL